MRRVSLKPYLLLIVALLSLLTLPKDHRDQARALTLAVLSPPLHLLNSFFSSKNKTEQEQLETLKVSNQLLTQEVIRLQKLLQHEELLVQNFQEKVLNPKHQKDLLHFLEAQLIAIPAEVVLRSSATWDSALWINVGLSDNNRLGRCVVDQNSPVIVGHSMIGVIDYVGERRSRVKLIGDPTLNLSVRAFREVKGKPMFLAKGELEGKASLKERSVESVVKGTGFNYDFQDDEGPARDLRTGEPLEESGDAIPIVLVGDLLITTGMDGVFPKGFSVGKVTKITPLKEGDFYFDLEACSTAGNLDALSIVYVLPPV
jgi:cell shape-determining protein MreC